MLRKLRAATHPAALLAGESILANRAARSVQPASVRILCAPRGGPIKALSHHGQGMAVCEAVGAWPFRPSRRWPIGFLRPRQSSCRWSRRSAPTPSRLTVSTRRYHSAGAGRGKQLLARFLTLSGDRLVPRALPLATQTSSPRFGGYFCSTSPEAMRTTVMAGPITWPGRVSPLRHRS
jgi:hypothetical protein